LIPPKLNNTSLYLNLLDFYDISVIKQND